MNKEIDLVKPVQRKVYEDALKELKDVTYKGYILEVVTRFPEYSENHVKNLIRGQKRSWKLLNAVRVVVGLKEVWPSMGVSDEQVRKDLKLEKVA